MYVGKDVNIPLGELALYTDDAQTITPPQGLLRAENIEVKNGFIEKQPGSQRWNANALPSGVAAFFDWWPNENTQRMIVVTKDGRVWRFSDPFHYVEVIPTGLAPARLHATNMVVMVSGGAEEGGRPRKLFIFTGGDPVQVISGDAITRSNLALPSSDWTSPNYPYFGIVYLNRLWCFGNQNVPHQMYGSSVINHEDFQTFGSIALVQVFPGDSERLITAASFKGRLVMCKYPRGYYALNVDNPATPFAEKLGDSFGGGSQLCALQVIDDLWVGNSSGTITSLTATNATGGFIEDDVVKDLKSYRALSAETAPLKNLSQHTLWYDAKKLAMFTYHSPSGTSPDRIFVVDFQSGRPRATIVKKDQPNCLALVKDILRVNRPFYGAEDGYLYQMDNPTRNVGGAAYTALFQTPYLDFSFLDRSMGEQNKNFDFLEVTFEPTGNWDLKADVFIDNRFSETVAFNMSQEDVLDKNFKLDVSRISGPGPRSIRRPIHGQGRRISVVFYQDGLNQNARISGMTFYFRPAGQQQRSV